jgi:acyl-CoA synthetase (AMP-forming)/AMP-acid ligase II
MAYIALKESESATGEALIAYCKEHLATFKVPCLIKFRDELPKLRRQTAHLCRGGVVRADKDRTGAGSVDHAFAIHR